MSTLQISIWKFYGHRPWGTTCQEAIGIPQLTGDTNELRFSPRGLHLTCLPNKRITWVYMFSNTWPSYARLMSLETLTNMHLNTFWLENQNRYLHLWRGWLWRPSECGGSVPQHDLWVRTADNVHSTRRQVTTLNWFVPWSLIFTPPPVGRTGPMARPKQMIHFLALNELDKYGDAVWWIGIRNLSSILPPVETKMYHKSTLIGVIRSKTVRMTRGVSARPHLRLYLDKLAKTLSTLADT